MREIFLSASVPDPKNPNYVEEGDPILINAAIRELLITIFSSKDIRLVWGGHPSITQMIVRICKDLGADYQEQFLLYQSKFFGGEEPDENDHINNIVRTKKVFDAMGNPDLKESLKYMRHQMLGRPDLESAVFIGGMKGIKDELDIFREHHPDGNTVFVASTGGMTRQLFKSFSESQHEEESVDFGRLFRREIVAEKRQLAEDY